MIVFHSFGAYGKLTKSQLFVIDSFKWFPEGFDTWMMERDKRPGAAKLRENRDYMHEVAAKLTSRGQETRAKGRNISKGSAKLAQFVSRFLDRF